MRSSRGSAIAELPAMLWFLFCLLIFPMIDIAAIGLRMAALSYITHTSCVLAARAPSFETRLNRYEPAMQVASDEANSLLSRFSGIRIKSIKTRILATNVNTKRITFYEHAMRQPANTSDFTYQIDVTIEASVDPLVTLPYLPVDIAGVTGPMEVKFGDRQFAECPQGLNI